VEFLCGVCNTEVWKREAEIEDQAKIWHNDPDAAGAERPRGFV
jgi:hypothetical protein